MHGYFVPPALLMRALREAAERGVDVRLLLPGVTDEPLVSDLCLSPYGDLMKSGVKIYERPREILHAKTITDREFASTMERQLEKDLEIVGEVSLEEWRYRSVFQKAKETLLTLLVKGQS